jgi:hypothetical protein
MTLVCDVVETTHNYVEHPQVIAERLERAVRAVGDRERVMAGTDYGFGTIVGDTPVSEDVVWAQARGDARRRGDCEQAAVGLRQAHGWERATPWRSWAV